VRIPAAILVFLFAAPALASPPSSDADRTSQYLMDSYGPQLVAEHREIVRAIPSGNSQAARERAAEHVSNTVNRSSHVDVRSVSIQPGKIPTNRSGDWLLAPAPTRTRPVRRSRRQLVGT